MQKLLNDDNKEKLLKEHLKNGWYYQRASDCWKVSKILWFIKKKTSFSISIQEPLEIMMINPENIATKIKFQIWSWCIYDVNCTKNLIDNAIKFSQIKKQL